MKAWYYIWLFVGLAIAIASVIAGKYHPLVITAICLLAAMVCRAEYEDNKRKTGKV